MAQENEEGQEKTEDPSEHRIEEFRRKGQVAVSKELVSAALLFGALMSLVMSATFMYEVIADYTTWIATLDIKLGFHEKFMSILVKQTALAGFKMLAPVFLTVMAVSIIIHLAQTGFIFAPDVLNLKFERINPLEGFKRLFSIRSVVEAFKGVLKFIFIMWITYGIMKDDFFTFGGYLHLSFVDGFTHNQQLIVKLSTSLLIGLAVIAIIDFAWVKYKHIEELKISKEESKRELKEREGNPEIKQRIKAIQRELANKRLISDVPKADVIVTNPTHISIMIKYDTVNMIAPIVLGKGTEHLALRIREIAKEHNIPIVENVPLARTLYKTVKAGEAIPRNLYKVVAEVLAFVYKLKKKQKAIS